MNLELYSKKDVVSFISEVFNTHGVFLPFCNYRFSKNYIPKYINSIYLINEWNKSLALFINDIQIPLFSFWHYHKKEMKLFGKSSLIKNKAHTHENLIMIKNVFFRQSIYAICSFVDKLKHAYSEIFNFSIKYFAPEKDIILDDIVVTESKLENEILKTLSDFKSFLTSKELKSIKELRNQEIHSVGGKTSLFWPKSESSQDWLKEPKVKTKGMNDESFILLLKDLFAMLQKQTENFKTINQLYINFLISIPMPGKIVPIK